MNFRSARSSYEDSVLQGYRYLREKEKAGRTHFITAEKITVCTTVLFAVERRGVDEFLLSQPLKTRFEQQISLRIFLHQVPLSEITTVPAKRCRPKRQNDQNTILQLAL